MEAAAPPCPQSAHLRSLLLFPICLFNPLGMKQPLPALLMRDLTAGAEQREAALVCAILVRCEGLSWHSPPCMGEHKIGVLVEQANWGWCFAQHSQRGGWCCGVVWCWEGEAELVRRPATGSLGGQWALGAAPTPRRAQHRHPQHGTVPAVCTGGPSRRAAGLKMPQQPFSCLLAGTIIIPPAGRGVDGNIPPACLQPLPGTRSILSCFTRERVPGKISTGDYFSRISQQGEAVLIQHISSAPRHYFCFTLGSLPPQAPGRHLWHHGSLGQPAGLWDVSLAPAISAQCSPAGNQRAKSWLQTHLCSGEPRPGEVRGEHLAHLGYHDMG